MSAPFTIAVRADAGISGTEKAAVLFATELATRGHRIIYLARPGPRSAMLAEAGGERMDAPENVTDFVALLKAERVDCVHQHVPGYPMPNSIYEAMRLMGSERPRLIETNVFGRLEDPEARPWVDFRFFISRASAVQAFQRAGLPLNAAALERMTVATYPLPPRTPHPDIGARRQQMRTELGIQPDDVLILRIGRPGSKWNWNEVQVFQQARRRNPRLRMLLMEPREEIWAEVTAGRWGEGILLHRAISDFDRLASIYAAGDLMLHMADWGESFGYTLAEAMEAGLPVITRTTPWGDNAQVELIEHEVNGYVCNSCAGGVESLVQLSEDVALRHRMGAAAAKHIAALSDIQRETDLVEEALGHLIHGKPLQKVQARNEDLLAFAQTFSARENDRTWEATAPFKIGYLGGQIYQRYRVFRSGLRQTINRRRARGLTSVTGTAQS